MKKPRAKLARGFFQPFRSRLAVFYVEQVALNRHVQVKETKNNPKRSKNLYRLPSPRQGELFQVVRRGISRFEWDGSAVLDES